MSCSEEDKGLALDLRVPLLRSGIGLLKDQEAHESRKAYLGQHWSSLLVDNIQRRKGWRTRHHPIHSRQTTTNFPPLINKNRIAQGDLRSAETWRRSQMHRPQPGKQVSAVPSGGIWELAWISLSLSPLAANNRIPSLLAKRGSFVTDVHSNKFSGRVNCWSSDQTAALTVSLSAAAECQSRSFFLHSVTSSFMAGLVVNVLPCCCCCCTTTITTTEGGAWRWEKAWLFPSTIMSECLPRPRPRPPAAADAKSNTRSSVMETKEQLVNTAQSQSQSLLHSLTPSCLPPFPFPSLLPSFLPYFLSSFQSKDCVTVADIQKWGYVLLFGRV